MKRQHILAFDKAAFGIEPLDGFITMATKTFWECASRSLFIGRREELEKDQRFGQVLPYVVLYQKREDGLYVFTYQRTDKIGEQRLAGNLSVGTGGHVDLADVVGHAEDASIIDLIMTLAQAIARELNEEVGFKQLGNLDVKKFDGLRTDVANVFPKFVGLINDHTNDVGRVHYGCVFAMEVPEGWEPYCREAELKTIGMVRADLALAHGDGAMENWSQLVLQNIAHITA